MLFTQCDTFSAEEEDRRPLMRCSPPERNGAHVSVSGKSLITVWAVPSAERKTCEDILIAEGLPILCRWLAQSSHAGNAWRSTAHDLSLVIHDGVLRHRES